MRFHPRRITLEREIYCTGERRNDDLREDIKQRDVDLASDSQESTPEVNAEQLHEDIPKTETDKSLNSIVRFISHMKCI